MRALGGFLAVVTMVTAASAQEEEPPAVGVSAEDCRAVVAHQPAPDVAYQPGVDALGRPVAPADLGGSPQIRLPDPLVIPITVDLAERLGLSTDPGALEPELQVGVVTVDRAGRVTFNGVPLTSDDQAALEAACREALR